MATTVLQNQEVWFDGYRLTTRVNSVAWEYGVETVDDTTFGDSTRSAKAGLKMATVNVEGLFDADTYDSALFTNMGVADKPITVGTSGTEGDVAFFMKMMEGSYTPFQNTVGELLQFSAGGMSTKSPLIRGTLMTNQSALTATGNGTARQLGAVTSGKKMYAALHVLSVAGSSTPTITVTVKSDDASGFPSPINRISFTAATAIGSQFSSVDGPVTDDWWRIDYTISGTSPVFGIVVALGIF